MSKLHAALYAVATDPNMTLPPAAVAGLVAIAETTTADGALRHALLQRGEISAAQARSLLGDAANAKHLTRYLQRADTDTRAVLELVATTRSTHVVVARDSRDPVVLAALARSADTDELGVLVRNPA